ncbi:MAG: SDR family NAD(P)-dependent oxidoreductase [Chitinophagaceae bacterium]|nr:MAG: SDR family NAD(P)-dependent oxidoreductase [Chitinophagaceae bacterium]
MKQILILGANSDVAKQAARLYYASGAGITLASRSIDELASFSTREGFDPQRVHVVFFDAEAFTTHAGFYRSLPHKPSTVLYAAGFQVENDRALVDWDSTYRMMNVLYAGAVSILNIIAMDPSNTRLERIIGLSSLSGVRGRKSNFIYGSTKSAFTQYLAGLRQYLQPRKIVVNVVVAGYIRSKMTAHLSLPESLLLEPAFVAQKVVHAGSGFSIVPGFKWKIIYQILKRLPERLVAKLP